MIISNVSFGIFAFMPQGWIFMLFIILMESLIISKMLTGDWKDGSVFAKVTVSNIVSGIVGIVASLKMNGGWWLVVWFPWVSSHEVHDNEIGKLFILYGLAFVATLLIELPLNGFLFKKQPFKSVLKASLIANLVSYGIGSLVLYTFSGLL